MAVTDRYRYRPLPAVTGRYWPSLAVAEKLLNDDVAGLLRAEPRRPLAMAWAFEAG